MKGRMKMGVGRVESLDGNKFVISEVGPKGKILWKADIGQVESLLVPVKFHGFQVETLIRGGRVHMRMAGRHMQNSKELQMPLHRLAMMQNDHSLHMHTLLSSLAARLAEEDAVFDALERQ